MDGSVPSGSGQPSAKRSGVSNKGDQHTIGDAVAVNKDKKAAILKLDFDCGDNAFDYLTLEDLVSIGKTCNRMQQLAGYCFQQNFSSFASCGSDGITRFFRYYCTNVEHFAPFIQINPDFQFRILFWCAIEIPTAKRNSNHEDEFR